MSRRRCVRSTHSSLKLLLFVKYILLNLHVSILFRSKIVIFRSSFPASNSTIGPPHASSPFSLQTGRANVLSKQLKFQKFQERCVQHDAFQRTTRNIKHRTTSYIGTLKTRDFWSKRAQIECREYCVILNVFRFVGTV